jgi:hypothetical protein
MATQTQFQDSKIVHNKFSQEIYSQKNATKSKIPNILYLTQKEKKLHQSITNRLNLIKNLPENWDTNGASNSILEKCKNFLLSIENKYIQNIFFEEDITPTPYGTLSIDFYNQKDENISVEIGENGFAFFTLFKEKTKDKMVECMPNLQNFLPKINESLKILFP